LEAMEEKSESDRKNGSDDSNRKGELTIFDLNDLIFNVNGLIQNFEEGTLGETSFLGGLRSEMGKFQNIADKALADKLDGERVFEQKFQKLVEKVLVSKVKEEKNFEQQVKGSFQAVRVNLMTIVNNGSKILDKLSTFEQDGKKNGEEMVEKMEKIRNDMGRHHEVLTERLKKGEQQNKTWAEVLKGSNFVMSQKVKEIQETTTVMKQQSEVQQREKNSFRVVIKGMKETSKKEDTIKEIVGLCKRNLKNVRFEEKDFVYANRIGMRKEGSLNSRPVILCFHDKNKRKIFWEKRFYLGKGEKVYVDADLSFEQRKVMRDRIAEIKAFNESRAPENRIRFKRTGHQLIVENRFCNMNVGLLEFLKTINFKVD